MIARLQSEALTHAWQQFPAVVLTGARQVGKTTLARWLLPDAAYVTLDNLAEAAAARLSPEQFLARFTRGSAILDEIQYAPELFRPLKAVIDEDRRAGRFLITGSQGFQLMSGVSESLAGRAAVFTLPALCLEEIAAEPTLVEADAFLWRSGFPELWRQRDLDRELWLASYVATYLERDVRQILSVGDLRDFDRFLRAAALRASQLLSYADLARDVGIAPNTAKRWISVLEASHQLFLLEPYHRQRAKRLIKSPKLYFSDTGLLCHLLGFRDFSDVPRHGLWGAVWENFVVSETRKRLLDTGRQRACWFWRTAQGEEVDLIIETSPERFVAIEAKTAERLSADALKGIRKLADEYGPASVERARVVCRTEKPYPLDGQGDSMAVALGGSGGLLDEVGRLFSAP